MLFDSYEDAVEKSHIIYKYLPVAEKNQPEWGIGKHTWVHYSDKTVVPYKNYNYYLVSPKYLSLVPAKYKETDTIEGARFFVKDINRLKAARNLPTVDYRSFLFK